MGQQFNVLLSFQDNKSGMAFRLQAIKQKTRVVGAWERERGNATTEGCLYYGGRVTEKKHSISIGSRAVKNLKEEKEILF